MDRKVKLTVTILDAKPTLSFMMIGFLSRLGYAPVTKKTRGSPGKLRFVFKREEDGKNTD